MKSINISKLIMSFFYNSMIGLVKLEQTLLFLFWPVQLLNYIKIKYESLIVLCFNN